MTYKLAVNRDNPLGYFAVDNDYKYYQLKLDYTGKTYLDLSNKFLSQSYAYMNTLRVTDETAKNNVPTINGVNYFSPIVMGNRTSVKLNSTSFIDIKNIYDVFVPSANPHTWSAEFWACLDWQDGQGVDFPSYDKFTVKNYRSDIGFRDSISTYPNILLLSIGYNTTFSGQTYFNNYASIIYNQKTNCIEFYVPQLDKSSGNNIYYVKSYAPVKDIDAPMHIYVTYSNQTINVAVNGVGGISAYVGSGLYSDTNILNNYYNLVFKFAGGYSYIDPSTNTLKPVKLQDNQYILLSNLTFYDYILNANQLANHIKWAFRDNYPTKSSIQYGTHFFPIEESYSNFVYNKKFNGNSFNDYTELYNLNISTEGLQPKSISKIVFNKVDGTSVVAASGLHGASWTNGKASLDFNDFGMISSTPCTISLVVEPSAATNEYIWSINNVNGSSTLFVERESNGDYSLKYYDILNGGQVQTLRTVTPSYAKQYHKIAVSLSSSSAILTVVSAESEISTNVNDVTNQSNPYSQTFSFASNSILSIGQSYHLGNDLSVLKANKSIFSFLGICDLYITNFANKYINGYYYANGFPWNGIIKYSCPFEYYADIYNPVSITQSFTVHQSGYWVSTIPLSALDGITGSKVEWGSTNNCLVEYSFNNVDPSKQQEENWFTLSRTGGPITGYNFSNKLSNMRIRVTMITKYDVQDINQTFNNLEVKFYRNMNFYSEGESFLITPQSKSTNNTSYTVKSNGKPIQQRANNLGLLFAYSSDDLSVPGYARVNNLYSKSIAGIDFWYRPDTNFSSTKILTGDSSVAGFPDLFLDAAGKICWNSNINSVYINGFSIPNGLTNATIADVTSASSVNAYDPIHIAVNFSRNNLISNPTFESNNAGWTSGQSSGVVRDNAFSFNTSFSGKVTMSSSTDANVATTTAPLVAGTYTISGYFYVPTGSTIAGRTISITSNTAGVTISNSTSATLTAGSWTRASARVTLTGNNTTVSLTASLSNTPNVNLSTASGNGSLVTYTTQGGAAHNLTTGDIVTITGFTPAGYNQTSKAVTVLNSTQFTIAGTTTGASSGTGLCAPALNLANASGQIIYTDAWLLEAGSNLSTFLSTPTLYSGDLYLNGTATQNGSESSYGFINVWENKMNDEDATNRYNLFVFNNQNIVYINNPLNNNPVKADDLPQLPSASTLNPVDMDLLKDMIISHRIGN